MNLAIESLRSRLEEELEIGLLNLIFEPLIRRNDAHCTVRFQCNPVCSARIDSGQAALFLLLEYPRRIHTGHRTHHCALRVVLCCPWWPATADFSDYPASLMRSYLHARQVKLYSAHLTELQDVSRRRRQSDSTVASTL